MTVPLDHEERRRVLVAEIEALSRAVEEQGVMIEGSRGQLVVNPAIKVRHAALAELRRLDQARPPHAAPAPLERPVALDRGPAPTWEREMPDPAHGPQIWSDGHGTYHRVRGEDGKLYYRNGGSN